MYLRSCWKVTHERFRLYSQCACRFRKEFFLCYCVIMEDVEIWGTDYLFLIDDIVMLEEETQYLMKKAKWMKLACLL